MLGALALLFTVLQAHISTCHPTSVAVEGRSLDQIYLAALKEPKTLTVAWGGDGTFAISKRRNDFYCLI